MPPSRPAIASAVARLSPVSITTRKTLIGERPQARRGIRTRLVAHGKRSGCPPADDEHGDGLPLTLQGFDPSQVFRGQRRALPGRLGRAEEKLDAVCGGGNTLAADGPGAFDGKERQAIGFGTRQDGMGQRMAGSLFERSGVAEDLRLRSAEADDVGQLRPAFGERSGLVEGDGCDPAEIFEDGAALDQKTAACTCRKARGDRGRRGDDEGAGATDQEKREPFINPILPQAAEEERRDDRDQCRDEHHARRVIAGEAIDETLRRRLLLLRLFDKPDDARDGIVGRRGGDAHPQRAVTIDGSGKDIRAGFLQDGRALAGHRRLVDAALAGDDDAIGREPVAGTDEDDGARGQAFGGNLHSPAVFFEERRFRHERRQRLYARPRLARGNALQQFPDQEEEDDHGRFLAGADEDGTGGRNGHQHLDREKCAGKCCHERTSCDRQQADEHGEGENPGLGGGNELADRIG